MNRAHHLQDDRLFDCYLAVQSGELLDPPVAEHLTGWPVADARGRSCEDVFRIVEAQFGREHPAAHRIHAGLDLQAHDRRNASIA